MFHKITHDTVVYLTYSVSFQSLLYKNAKDASHRSRLSSEMMIYHMTVSTGEVFSLAWAIQFLIELEKYKL